VILLYLTHNNNINLTPNTSSLLPYLKHTSTSSRDTLLTPARAPPSSFVSDQFQDITIAILFRDQVLRFLTTPPRSFTILAIARHHAGESASPTPFRALNLSGERSHADQRFATNTPLIPVQALLTHDKEQIRFLFPGLYTADDLAVVAFCYPPSHPEGAPGVPPVSLYCAAVFEIHRTITQAIYNRLEIVEIPYARRPSGTQAEHEIVNNYDYELALLTLLCRLRERVGLLGSVLGGGRVEVQTYGAARTQVGVHIFEGQLTSDHEIASIERERGDYMERGMNFEE
jgi:hypothetical protein